MAKVEGPLFSLSARGKMGDSLVFFPWKGRHVVRRWLIPTNPEKDLQGYVRAALKTIGLQVKIIACKSKGDAVDSKLYNGAVAKAPAGMNWNAFHGQGLLNLMQVANAFATTAFLAKIGEYSTHAAKTAWDSQATALGLLSFSFPYGYTTAIAPGCQLYFGALAAYANLESWGAAYTLIPTTMAASDVNAFATAHTA